MKAISIIILIVFSTLTYFIGYIMSRSKIAKSEAAFLQYVYETHTPDELNDLLSYLQENNFPMLFSLYEESFLVSKKLKETTALEKEFFEQMESK